MGAFAGPLLAALVVLPYGRASLAWFSLFALLAMLILWRVGVWYRDRQRAERLRPRPAVRAREVERSAVWPVAVLLILMFSKFFYTTSLHSYLTFYLIDKFAIPVGAAQVHLFVFLFGAVFYWLCTRSGRPAGRGAVDRLVLGLLAGAGLASGTLAAPLGFAFGPGVETGAGGGAGKFINVCAGAGAGRARGH